MRAAVARRYGPPETLTLEELPAPEPGPGAARFPLERVAAALRLVAERRALGKVVLEP